MTNPEYIVDAHHHLWDLEYCHYPWLMEKGVKRFFGDPAPIQKNYLAQDLIDDFEQLPVRKSVHIQVGVDDKDSVKETQWLQSCADENDFPNAIIGFCDLRSDNLEQIIDQHSESPNFRGVRQIVGRSAEEDSKTGTASLLDDPDFRTGLGLLAEKDLSFDLQLTPPLIEKAAELLHSVSDLPVALCHCGSLSDFSEEGIDLWQRGLKKLAENEQVLCKISGFGMFNHNWTVDDIRPLILTVIDIFGPYRIAFGSNFPVDKLYASYADVMRAYLRITEDFSKNERGAMFHGNAESFYKI